MTDMPIPEILPTQPIRDRASLEAAIGATTLGTFNPFPRFKEFRFVGNRKKAGQLGLFLANTKTPEYEIEQPGMDADRIFTSLSHLLYSRLYGLKELDDANIIGALSLGNLWRKIRQADITSPQATEKLAYVANDTTAGFECSGIDTSSNYAYTVEGNSELNWIRLRDTLPGDSQLIVFDTSTQEEKKQGAIQRLRHGFQHGMQINKIHLANTTVCMPSVPPPVQINMLWYHLSQSLRFVEGLTAHTIEVTADCQDQTEFLRLLEETNAKLPLGKDFPELVQAGIVGNLKLKVHSGMVTPEGQAKSSVFEVDLNDELLEKLMREGFIADLSHGPVGSILKPAFPILR